MTRTRRIRTKNPFLEGPFPDTGTDPGLGMEAGTGAAGGTGAGGGATVAIRFVVTPDHRPGDYAMLHSNGGDGAIDWDTPVTGRKYELYPGGAGFYGFGHGPFGHTPFGHGMAIGVNTGFGHGPFGHTPFGHGATVITCRDTVHACGSYTYGVKIFDAAGNAHTGTPDEVTVDVHTTPGRATPLKLVSYDPDDDILIMEVA